MLLYTQTHNHIATKSPSPGINSRRKAPKGSCHLLQTYRQTDKLSKQPRSTTQLEAKGRRRMGPRLPLIKKSQKLRSPSSDIRNAEKQLCSAIFSAFPPPLPTIQGEKPWSVCLLTISSHSSFFAGWLNFYNFGSSPVCRLRRRRRRHFSSTSNH